MWCFSMRDKYAALNSLLLDVYQRLEQVKLVCMFLQLVLYYLAFSLIGLYLEAICLVFACRFLKEIVNRGKE